MSTPPTPLPAAVTHIVTHVLSQLRSHSAWPLCVGVQGPQGSGKTYLTRLLQSHLSSPPHALSVALLSLDDLYLPHEGLVQVAREYPGNRLLKGRGQPGTHDLPLGSQLLRDLLALNDAGSSPVLVPVFDKSLHSGEGDRLPPSSSVPVHPPLDLILFEGWCTGFSSTTPDEIRVRYDDPKSSKDLDPDEFDLRGFASVEEALEVNELLEGYNAWWDLIDVFVQLTPPPTTPYTPIYKWRLEQEHAMKARNGGRGMSDEQVKAFVNRYIPGYIFFSDGVTRGSLDPTTQTHTAPRWTGRSLRITLNQGREVVGMEGFNTGDSKPLRCAVGFAL